MRISDWSSDVCSSDLVEGIPDRRIKLVILRDRIADENEIDGRGGGTDMFLRHARGLDEDGRFAGRRGMRREGRRNRESPRSEERREGRECDGRCKSGWTTYH